MNATNPDLVTVNTAARARGIYAPRLRRAIRSGELPALQIGAWARLRLADVDRWLARHRVVAPSVDTDDEQLRDALTRVRAFLESFLESDGGLRGRVRGRHALLSSAVDLIADALDGHPASRNAHPIADAPTIRARREGASV